MSRLNSATSRFSFAFSRSNSFNRLAWYLSRAGLRPGQHRPTRRQSGLDRPGHPPAPQGHSLSEEAAHRRQRTLTDTEAQKFWPVYEEFTEQLVMINNDKYALIKEYAQNYGTMTDAQADNWTQRILAVDANVSALRQKYWKNFSQVLPPKKTALYEHVESRA